ncbi:hypothetical protein C8R43DRAFT_1046726 [Mycena crocata]|nr:hypothetical protein C8R43DRAFT_1046726 [Mycena crocata]
MSLTVSSEDANLTIPISVRDSVYHLTALGSVLETREPRTGALNPRDDFQIRDRTPTSSNLNRLATILSRGKYRDENVTVTAGPFELNGMAIFVSSRSEPGTSSSAAVDGTVFRGIVPCPDPGRAMGTLDRIIASDPFDPEVIPSLPFPEFVAESLHILRTAAVRVKAEPDDAIVGKTYRAVCLYFVTSCCSKLRHRLRRVLKTYPPAELATWKPSAYETLPEVQVKIFDAGCHIFLEKVGLIVGEDDAFTYNKTTAVLWWEALILILQRLQSAVDERSIPAVVILSRALNQLLQKLPKNLWNSSLSDCLSSSRMASREGSVAPDPVPLASNEKSTDVDQKVSTEENQKVSSDGKPFDAAQGEDFQYEDDEDPPPEHILPARSGHEAVMFYRALLSVCVWTSSPLHLLQSHFARTAVPINLAVISLPHAPLSAGPAPTEAEKISAHADALLAHWDLLSLWSEDRKSTVRNDLRKMHLELTKPLDNACHCEAGLIAALLIHLRDPQQQESPDVVPAQPAVLSAAFECMAHQVVDSHTPFALGVAAACCTACRLLVKTARKPPYKLQLELPGTHNDVFGDESYTRIHPWMPPPWLPDAVLRALERELMWRVDELLQTEENSRQRRTYREMNKDIFLSAGADLTGFETMLPGPGDELAALRDKTDTARPEPEPYASAAPN